MTKMLYTAETIRKLKNRRAPDKNELKSLKKNRRISTDLPRQPIICANDSRLNSDCLQCCLSEYAVAGGLLTT